MMTYIKYLTCDRIKSKVGHSEFEEDMDEFFMVIGFIGALLFSVGLFYAEF